MGVSQSIPRDYKIQRETKNAFIVTKEDDTYLLKKIDLEKMPREAVSALTNEMEILKEANHPHIVSFKNSVRENNIYYIVMDYCQGGDLAIKVKEKSEESEVLSWIAEICIALRYIHEKGLLHKCLKPENIFLTEFGSVCLGDFGKVFENSKTTDASLQEMSYLPPELFTKGTFDAKSDIWSLGCIIYEICTQKPAFTAETTIKLMPKLIHGPHPCLPETFSPELRQLVIDIFNTDPQSRPTASEILERPFIINCLSNKCKTTVDDLQIKLVKLREVADSLERVHQGTTIGSLTGGVIGAVGGITSIVGLILTPFTFGASLIVTGVGVGVGALGGLTAGASNVTNMVNQASDRKAVRSIIKYFEHKTKLVVTWLQEIGHSLNNIRSRYGSTDTLHTENNQFSAHDLAKAGRAGRGLVGLSELTRLIRVINVGRIAAQASRVVRVAEVATGVFSGLFIAVDIFFIAMDAREIHHIKQAQAAGEGAASEAGDNISTSSVMQEHNSHTSQEQGQSSRNATQVRSEIMRFVQSVRQAADDLQGVLNELKDIISSLPSNWSEGDEGWSNMELVQPKGSLK
ncbi:calcium/calmodulin-dependent protein kinase type II-like [Echeneis naucrates]|uniref:non-specific serine/threonine protein kinase n=1 Tax=Echeneis naucrates TaxID=173247 RepID=A0A665T2H5_ECHNA|nr:calcium/calmodulin-dependent protein kinase type II-like [Echeneis naucrates]